jgi:hypothetical protein
VNVRGRRRLFISSLVILLAIFFPAVSGAALSISGHPLLNFPVMQAEPVPVSDRYVPPPGVMPVVILEGTPYEMGYQYGLQVPEYIAIVRDAAWASALSTNSYDQVVDSCRVEREYIATELTGFRFTDFFLGMSDAMNDQGYSFSPIDPIVMIYYGGRQGPVPEEHCTAFAAYGNATGNGLVAGVNFDYFQVPSNSYEVLLALYPDDGYSCILPSGAGRTGSNAVVNEEGLVYILTAAPGEGAGDLGPGISGFLELPYVGMTAGNVSGAREALLTMTRAFGLNRLLADRSGTAEVIEATRARYAIRYPAGNGSGEYLIATNHYLDPAMKPSQKIWDPVEYYPSSYYRYITTEKMIQDHYGSVNYSIAREVFSLTDWWDGREWHLDDPWSTNSIDRFTPDFATLYSLIAVPGNGVVSICLGNPDMPYWGTKAPGLTGTYFNITVGATPENLVYQLRSDAERELWNTVQVIGTTHDREVTREWASIENQYWEGVWWHNRGVLEKTSTAQAVAFGRAATDFSAVIAHAGQLREYCSSGT